MENTTALNKYRENSILAALSEQEYGELLPHLEAVDLPYGKNIYNYGDAIDYVYFPIDSIVYLFTIMENGATAEAGIIGFEGVLGISALMGVGNMPNQSLVLNSSRALRIKVGILNQIFNDGGHLQTLLLRYIHTLYVQISQTAACNRVHHIEERLARWLLMMHDRTKNDELTVTQEFIAQMLGTRRPYITISVGILHKRKIISCRRGHIKILDRSKLEDCACECYRIIQNEFSELREIISSKNCSRRQPKI